MKGEGAVSGARVEENWREDQVRERGGETTRKQQINE